MTHLTQAISPLRQRMIDDMRMHLRLLADLLGLAPFAAQELKSRLA